MSTRAFMKASRRPARKVERAKKRSVVWTKVISDKPYKKKGQKRPKLAKPEKQVADAKVEVRVSLAHKRRLQTAATVEEMTLSAFVLESALERASDVLADRTTFVLDAAHWDAFVKALDAPVRPLPRLSRLLREPAFGE